MEAEADLAPPPEPTASPEPEILLRNRNDDRDWKADMMSALGDSVSFGRFLSEPLEWGKWSAFQHNRYLEEAAGQARPGSVAQRKAFFEDHYARKRKKSQDAGEDDDDSSPPDSSSPEELKAVATNGAGLPCSSDEWSHKHEQDDDAQLAESREGLQLDDGSVVATVVVDSPEKQPLQEISTVNQESINDGSAKKRRLPIASSLFQKPVEFSSPPSGKKTPVKRRSSTLGSAKENSSPSPSTHSKKQREGASVAHKRSPFGMSMNFRRCETGNPASSRSRNIGTTIASRISQLESASRPVKDTHPKVNQFRQTRKGFFKGVPEIASKTSQQHEQRSSHVTMTRVKEKLFGSFSSPVHPKTNIATENTCAQEIPNLPNSDASNPHVLSRGAPKDKQICCFPLRRLC